MSSRDLSYLLDKGICPWCLLRYLNDDDYNHYHAHQELASARAKATVKTSFDIEYIEPDQCFVCLNLIPRALSPEMIKKLLETYSEAGYEGLTSYMFNVTIPAMSLIRDHYMLRSHVGDVEIISIKEAIKYSLGPEIASLLRLSVDFSSNFKILLRLKSNAQFPKVFLQHNGNQRKQFKNIESQRFQELTPEIENENSIANALINRADFLQRVDYIPAISGEFACELSEDVILHRDPIFVLGRYRKIRRGISQTPWIEKSLVSVSDCIGQPLLEATHGVSIYFHAAGREDIDVLMLGTGRPFIIEITQPKVPDAIYSLNVDKINAGIKQRHGEGVEIFGPITIVDKSSFDRIKEGEEDKKKHYRAKCWSDEPVTQSFLDSVAESQNFPMAVDQKTPIRVLHRRTNMSRAKTVYELSFELINEHEFYCYILSSAGMYIKEFCHGDMKRTNPNLSTMLFDKYGMVDIEELDVTEVDLDISEYFK